MIFKTIISELNVRLKNVSNIYFRKKKRFSKHNNYYNFIRKEKEKPTSCTCRMRIYILLCWLFSISFFTKQNRYQCLLSYRALTYCRDSLPTHFYADGLRKWDTRVDVWSVILQDRGELCEISKIRTTRIQSVLFRFICFQDYIHCISLAVIHFDLIFTFTVIMWWNFEFKSNLLKISCHLSCLGWRYRTIFQVIGKGKRKLIYFKLD